MIKKLGKDVSMAELLHMRAEGMTNHQIAQRLGVCDTTIYRYIGKRSFAVVNAEAQNKPCPIFPSEVGPLVSVQEFHKEMPDDVKFVPIRSFPEAIHAPEEQTEETIFEEVHSSMKEIHPVEKPGEIAGLKVLRVCHIFDLQGSLSTYHVNMGDGTVEMTAEGGSLITGMLDKQSIPEFISELQAVLGAMSGD